MNANTILFNLEIRAKIHGESDRLGISAKDFASRIVWYIDGKRVSKAAAAKEFLERFKGKPW